MEKGVHLFILEVHLLYTREADFLKILTKAHFAGRRDMKDAASKNGNTIAGLEDEIKRLKAKVCYVFFAVGGFACLPDAMFINTLRAAINGYELKCRSKSKTHVSSKMRTPLNAANNRKATSQKHCSWPTKRLPALKQIA
jgi:hypothetical protein